MKCHNTPKYRIPIIHIMLFVLNRTSSVTGLKAILLEDDFRTSEIQADLTLIQ